MKDLGEVKTIIGWEITQDLTANTLKIDQKGYIQDLLKAKEMTFCHPTVLLVKAGSTFFLDQAGDHQQANLIAYQCLIGKLIYLSCGTRPDIVFVVRQLSCHNSDLHKEYLHIAKQVLRYLNGTITLGIEWENNLAGYRLGEKYRELGMVRYADSSYAGNLEDRKSITRYCFFLARGIVTCCSKRQCTVSTSTLEAEYVAVNQGAREGVWLQRFLNKLLPKNAVREIKMFGNNKTSFTLTKDPKSQNWTKHINVMQHHVRKLVKDEELAIDWIESSAMLADGLTKAFSTALFKKHWGEWGLIE